MNPADLALLQDVARLGSFAAAAEARGIDASSVSRAVAGIETDLGIRIFERTTRRLNLTEAGDHYLTRATPVMEELARITAEARRERLLPQGLLRISASVTFGQRRLVPLIGAFRGAYPEVSLDCIFTDANVDLIGERLDLAIRLAPTIEGDLVATKLMPTAYRVVASPDYLAKAAPLTVPDDLRAHRVLRFNLRAFRNRWIFDNGQGMQEVPIAGDITITPAGALLNAAVAGLGPALLPDWLVDGDIAAGRLVHCLSGWRVTATTFDTGAWAVYPSRSYLPAKVRAMIDFLRTTLPLPPSPI
jgi:DNA-binding transcriptional LysR family regulator